jgi:hypothetical protein
MKQEEQYQFFGLKFSGCCNAARRAAFQWFFVYNYLINPAPFVADPDILADLEI